MTERWTPQLANPPEIAGPLLSCLRRVIPTLFDAALQAPEAATKPVAALLELETDPSAQLYMVGRDLSRGDYGPRDALFLNIVGQAQFRGGTLPVAGDAVLDLATNALLRLRLTEPMAL